VSTVVTRNPRRWLRQLAGAALTALLVGNPGMAGRAASGEQLSWVLTPNGVAYQYSQDLTGFLVTTVTVTTTGTGNFTIPAGITSINFECWGAGGGGGGTATAQKSGGGSGGYHTATISCVAGDVFYYTVGTGGTAGNAGGATGVRKNNSNLSVMMYAGGGGAGSTGSAAAGGSAGLIGDDTSDGWTNLGGGNGSTGGAAATGGGSRGGGGGAGSAGAAGGGGAGSAGSGSTGGSGGTAASGTISGGAAGNPGTSNVEGGGGGGGGAGGGAAGAGGVPGGGGGGGGSSSGASAAGGRGQIRYTYNSDAGGLSDDFGDNSRDTAKWNVSQFYSTAATNGTVSEVNARLEVTPTASLSGNNFNGYVSVGDFSLWGNSTYCKISATGAITSSQQAYLAFGPNENYCYMAFLDGGTGQLNLLKWVNGSYSSTGNTAYDSSAHAWVRLRHDAVTNTVKLDVAPSSASNPPASGDWSNLYSAAWDGNVPAVRGKVALGTGTFGSVASPVTVYFDGVNSATTLGPSVVVNNAGEAQASTQPTLAAKSTVAPADSAQADASTQPTVAPNSVLTPADAAQANAAQQATLAPHGPDQFIEAASDSTVSGWQASAGTSLSAVLDSGDEDYIFTYAGGSADVIFQPAGVPEVRTNHTVRYRAAGDGNSDLKVTLLCGGTTIATWTETTPGASFTTYQHGLTQTQAEAITDYGDLRLRFELG